MLKRCRLCVRLPPKNALCLMVLDVHGAFNCCCSILVSVAVATLEGQSRALAKAREASSDES